MVTCKAVANYEFKKMFLNEDKVKQHLIDIISTSSSHSFLLERAVTGLLRLGIRLLHREDLQSPVLQR